MNPRHIKSGIYAAALGFALTGLQFGCGIDFKVGNGGGTTPTQLAEDTAEAIDASVEFALDFEALAAQSSSGQALVPDLSGGSVLEVGQAPSGLAPAALEDNCPVGIFGDDLASVSSRMPDDRICSVKTEGTQIGIYVPEDAVRKADIRFVDFWRTFGTDTATGVTRLIDTEAPNGTTEADLWNHVVDLAEVWYPRRETRLVKKERATRLSTRGCPHDRVVSDFCDADRDQPDLVYSQHVTTQFADGAVIYERAIPNEPTEFPTDLQFVSGVYTREIVRTAERPIVAEYLEVVADRENDYLEISERLEFADGSRQTRETTIDGELTRVEEVHPSGRTVDAEFDRGERRFLRQVVYEAGHRRIRLSESGEISRSGGIFERTIEFADGEVQTDIVTVTLSATEIQYDMTFFDGRTASLSVGRNGDSRVLAAEIETPRGRTLSLAGSETLDGTLEFNFWLDDENANCDVDDDRPTSQRGAGFFSKAKGAGFVGQAYFCNAKGEAEQLDIDLSQLGETVVRPQGPAPDRRPTRELDPNFGSIRR